MKRILSLFLVIILFLTPFTQVEAATLKLNQSKAVLDVSDTLKLKLGNIKGNKVTWSSSKNSVATVSKWGTVTAKSEGTTTITAKYKGKKIYL